MKPQLWLPAAVFLGVSIPLVLLLNVFQVGGEYRLWIAIGVGALATAWAQSRFASRAARQRDEPT